jgi:hypothetical protein
MVEIDSRLTDVEKRFIEGWVEGIGKKLGLSEEQLRVLVETRKDDLVAIAHKWREDLLKVVKA